MNDKKYMLAIGLFFSIPSCYAVTVADVQNLKVTTFFGEWSKFLDQVLQAQQDPMSPENEAIYQAFIQQAKTLQIPKVTGNKESISAMQEQIKLLKKRIKDEKQLAGEWKQLSEAVMNAQQPVSVENQEAYKELIKRAKDVGIQKNQIDVMEAKMTELKNKLGLAIPLQPVPPAPIMPPVTPMSLRDSMPIPPAPDSEIKK